ncbi:hypothetical protein SRHO_G00152420 [Serrasalmus rhombeus]
MTFNQTFPQQDSLYLIEEPSDLISRGHLILLNQFQNAGQVTYTIAPPPVQLMVQNDFPPAGDGTYTITPSSGQLMVNNQFAATGEVTNTIAPPSGQPVVWNQFPAAEGVIYTVHPSSGWDGSAPLLAPAWAPPFMNHYGSGVRPPRQPESTDAAYQQTDHQRHTAELPSRQENRETERPAKRKRKRSTKRQEKADDRPCRRARLDSREKMFHAQIKPDAVVDEDGQITFSEEIMDLLEAVPHILDLAREMGFSV